MERKTLRYGRLQMGTPDEHGAFIYLAVTDNTDVDKVCEKFHLSKPEAGYFGKTWFSSQRVKPDDFGRGAPLAIIYINSTVKDKSARMGTLAH